VRDGFKGPIYCSEATADLCAILLPDGGHIQEDDAAAANRYGYAACYTRSVEASKAIKANMSGR
jgi:Cft2 family RNA processing exonuclease